VTALAGDDRPPEPVPLTDAIAGWLRCADDPELACVPAWSTVCEAWWNDPEDLRLRTAVLSDLRLDAGELHDWLARPLDGETLVAAHGHVTAMRAALERDPSQRRLTSGALRSRTVAAKHRGGARTYFVPASEVAERVAALAPVLAALPGHPLLRASWTAQAVGAIHPFLDSNGGTLRFLASLELARAHLPPLRLTHAQRNGTYIDGLMHANRTGELAPLAHVVADTVQAGLATSLLDTPRVASWERSAREHAAEWEAIVEATWFASLGGPEPTRATVSSELARARAVRRGMRFPPEPPLRATRWTLDAPLPIHLDLVIAPTRGGAASWLVATVAISIGDDPALFADLPGEAVAVYIVAPDGEPDGLRRGRFQRWAGRRLEQCVRGISRWL
jgi:hypothetical protein